MFSRATARRAAACALTRAAMTACTCDSAPQATTSRRPVRAVAAACAIASSPTTALRCRVAMDGSRAANSASDTTIGTATEGSTAGTRVASPMSALTAMKTNVRPIASSPATLSLTISAWWVIRATAPEPARFGSATARRSALVTMMVTRSSRSGSTTAATLR